MIKIPKNKVAVVPIFDSTETKGGILRASSFVYKRETKIYEIFDYWSNKKLDEAEDKERAQNLIKKYERMGFHPIYKAKKIKLEDQPLDAGERCDQGIVKYIGNDVKEINIGDYVFFSGYTGTLISIEDEGLLIILPEEFIICTFDIDRFITIPGLYFKDKNGNYFEATYEQAMNIISSIIPAIEIKSEEPKLEDYNVR